MSQFLINSNNVAPKPMFKYSTTGTNICMHALGSDVTEDSILSEAYLNSSYKKGVTEYSIFSTHFISNENKALFLEESKAFKVKPSKGGDRNKYTFEQILGLFSKVSIATDNINTEATSEDENLDGEGVVVAFKDFVVTISGLRNVQLNEMIRFEGGASGLVLSLEENFVKGIVFSGSANIYTGIKVYRTDSVMLVGVGEAVLGRVVNAIGEPLDGLADIAFSNYMRVERKAPGVITRYKVSEPLVTGLKVVDALVPIGKGQRELILGDRKTGKTTIAIDTILNQKSLLDTGESPLVCIYVAIGKRLSEIMRLTQMFSDKGALSYTTVVAAPASDPAALQYLAPYSACTMAEYFTYKGQHSLIVYDDLSKHADAYRQLALLLRRPVGREAYPGDIFYLHSRLLERAVKMNEEYLSGSLTALPVVETVQGDVSAYIPTNIISITDGQIYLDLNMHQEGTRPAVDPGISVSRVGSAAQYKSMKAFAGSLKLELAQYREVAQFSKFGSELDAATRKVLAKGELLLEILKQPRNLPIAIYKQVVLLFAAATGFFDLLLDNSMSLVEYQHSLFSFLEQSPLVEPFKRFINISVEKELFNFFLNYHYNT